MTVLDVADRQRLVLLLRTVPMLETEESRTRLLDLAGAPAMDMSGSPHEVADRLVHYLTQLGPRALGLFLNLVKGIAGAEEQDFLADVLTRYGLMTPVVRAPGIGDWRGAAVDPSGPHPPLSVAFLRAAVEAARCVAHVRVASAGRSWSGTGHLVGPDMLLTPSHVLGAGDLVAHTTFRFDDRDECEDVAALDGGLFHTNADLDYTLVQLAGRPGDRWGHLPLTAETVAVGDRVSVVQHSGGGRTRITLRDNVVAYAGGGVVQYVTATLPGSSGAPVLTDEWRVCAIHHAGDAGTLFRGEGIATAAILRDLPTAVRAALP